MEAVFLKIFNMSITAGWLVFAVVLLRFLLRKAPKGLTVLMWGLVGLRLVLPFSLESIFSLVPSAETVPENIVYSESPTINSGIGFFNSSVNPVISESLAPTPENSVNPMQVVVFIAAVVWVCGIAAMLIYTAASYLKLRRKVNEAVVLRDNIMLCDSIDTPFILGLIRPKIYLPSSLSPDDTKYVIAHERAHLKRCDHLIKPFSFVLLTVYWFNPVLWVAYVLLCRDIELACDEKVIRQMGAEAKKPYSDALINCSIPRRAVSACPLAFGEVGVKSRIKAVLSYKKPAFWVIIVAVVASIVLSVCFLTDPKTSKLKNIEGLSLENAVENTVSVYVGDENSYSQTVTVDREVLNQLSELKISSKPTSNDRSEDRDMSHVLILQEKSDIKSISSTIEGTYICFSVEFSSVWVTHSDKTTLSYRVFDPAKAKQLVLGIKTVQDAEDEDLMTLREMYPEYFGLSTSKGLEVYIWQMSKNNYSCGLMEGTNREKTDAELTDLKGASIQEMRLILSTYEILQSNISLYAYHNPLSSYYYDINDQYYEELHNIFWHDDLLSSFGGVDGPENVTVSSTAVYGYMSSPDPVRPTLELTKESNHFCFSWSGFSSYIAVGNYAISDGILKLHTSDGLYTYVFEQMGARFKFLADRSSQIPSYKYSENGEEQSPVPDGAIFEPIVKETKQFGFPIISTANADIDGDGIKEACTLSIGPTSGLYTFRFTAVSEKSDYYNVFMPGDPSDMSFVVENGKLRIHFTSSGGDDTEIYDVTVKDGNIVLSFDNGKKQIPYWGNQRKS